MTLNNQICCLLKLFFFCSSSSSSRHVGVWKRLYREKEVEVHCDFVQLGVSIPLDPLYLY
jgi:hypothetical protein